MVCDNTLPLKGKAMLVKNVFQMNGLDKPWTLMQSFIKIGQNLRELKMFKDFKTVFKKAAILNI